MRFMMPRTALRVALAVSAAAGVLATAACAGSVTPAPSASASSSGGASATPAPTNAGAASGDRLAKVSVLAVQCFADHNLIPASALNTGKSGSPPSDSSTWLHDGKVTENLPFGDWYRDAGAGVTVKGKLIGEWVSEIAANSSAWPSSVCGPMPSLSS
jgi:hypothetical protein